MLHKKKYRNLVGAIMVIMLLVGCQTAITTKSLPDPRNTTLTLNDLVGQPATLENGVFAGDHLTVQVLESAVGDLNQDGLSDAVIVILKNTGGSGNFRDLCLLLNVNGELEHTDSVTLGDRIKVTSLALNSEIITVQYLDRKPGDSLAMEPSVPKKVRYRVKENKLEKITELKLG